MIEEMLARFGYDLLLSTINETIEIIFAAKWYTRV